MPFCRDDHISSCFEPFIWSLFTERSNYGKRRSKIERQRPKRKRKRVVGRSWILSRKSVRNVPSKFWWFLFSDIYTYLSLRSNHSELGNFIIILSLGGVTSEFLYYKPDGLWNNHLVHLVYLSSYGIPLWSMITSICGTFWALGTSGWTQSWKPWTIIEHIL